MKEQIEKSKKQLVRGMFNSIAHRYDFLNHLLSFGIDRIWRRKTVKSLFDKSPLQILDIATGTGDLALALMKLKPEQIIGIDISENMLEYGKLKIAQKGLSNKITFQIGDSENLSFSNNSFDAVTVAFGVRNFENPLKGIQEIYRVLKPGGRVAILEFSKPISFPFKQMYSIYFNWVLPLVGKVISGDQNAYTYLPESVKSFPDRDNFLEFYKKAGFSKMHYQSLTGGIACLYVADK